MIYGQDFAKKIQNFSLPVRKECNFLLVLNKNLIENDQSERNPTSRATLKGQITFEIFVLMKHIFLIRAHCGMGR